MAATKRINLIWIIIIFAFLHILAILMCRKANISSKYILTALSIAMTTLVCIRQKLDIKATVICIILVNLLGAFLGNELLHLLRYIFGRNRVNGPLSTFMTTCILGYSLTFIGKILKPAGNDSYRIKEKYILYLTVVSFIILTVRIVFEDYITNNLFTVKKLNETITIFFNHPTTLLIMVCLSIFLTANPSKSRRHVKHKAFYGFLILFVVMCPVVSGFLMLFLRGNAYVGNVSSLNLFIEIYVASLIIEATAWSVALLVNYAFEANARTIEERAKADQAKMQYLSLKRQMSPHFLFNNLNILDCMVAEGKNKDARNFINNLAGVYRFMLKYEDEAFVTLREELTYVKMYVNLLTVRFPDGLSVSYDIRENDMESFICTYSIQLLVENAVKHNSTQENNPLRISISTDGNNITVVNNLIPRLSPVESTGHGLEYIKQSYKERCGMEIYITQTDCEYKVSIPLI